MQTWPELVSPAFGSAVDPVVRQLDQSAGVDIDGPSVAIDLTGRLAAAAGSGDDNHSTAADRHADPDADKFLLSAIRASGARIAGTPAAMEPVLFERGGPRGHIGADIPGADGRLTDHEVGARGDYAPLRIADPAAGHLDLRAPLQVEPSFPAAEQGIFQGQRPCPAALSANQNADIARRLSAPGNDPDLFELRLPVARHQIKTARLPGDPGSGDVHHGVFRHDGGIPGPGVDEAVPHVEATALGEDGRAVSPITHPGPDQRNLGVLGFDTAALASLFGDEIDVAKFKPDATIDNDAG